MSTVNYIHGNIYERNIEDLNPDRNQARKFFCPDAHAELCRSISAVGLIQPITVTSVDGELQIVSGERRWRAAKAAGLEFAQVRFIDQNVSAISLIVECHSAPLPADGKASPRPIVKTAHIFSI